MSHAIMSLKRPINQSFDEPIEGEEVIIGTEGLAGDTLKIQI